MKPLHVEEPELLFRFGQKAAYPRDGLFLFGPVDASDHPRAVNYGVIGTAQSASCFAQWAADISGFIDVPPRGRLSKEREPHHVPFPGMNEAFHAAWTSTPARLVANVDRDALLRTLRIANRHEAVKAAVDVFVNALVAEHNRLEDPPAFWFVALPEFVYELGRPKSTVAVADRIPGRVALREKEAAELDVQPTLFGEDERDAEVYKYGKNFRRQLKARLLEHRIVTQLVRETTLAPHRFLRADGKTPIRRLEDKATVAWKLGVGSYYKSGGRPWQLADVRPGVCYVGLVYKQLQKADDLRHACCAAQMFLSDGEGIVFRGALGPWYQPDRDQFHLDSAAAASLVDTVLKEYRNGHGGEDPAELFIHAKSSFSDDEWAGFTEACTAKTNVVGVQIADGWDQLKLFRPGAYPVLRGTALPTSELSAFLFTSGYVPRLDTYMGPDTPNPLVVSVRRGKAELRTVLSDVMALTKINFNTCLYNDRKPVTIRFADAIGDVIAAAPVTSAPRLPFKFYI